MPGHKGEEKQGSIVKKKEKMYGCVEVAFASARISIELLGDC